MSEESRTATNVSIDPDLLDRALKVGGERTGKAAITEALREFIARRQQMGLRDLVGALEWDDGFDYQAERSRHRACSSTPACGRWHFGAMHRSRRRKCANCFGAIKAGEPLFTTGLVLQELLQGFPGPRDRAEILDHFFRAAACRSRENYQVDVAEFGTLPAKAAGRAIWFADPLLDISDDWASHLFVGG